MANEAVSHHAPNPVDRHVGQRMRMRRKALGISQEKLAASVGLTFQQIQKYERAANRVSASKLWEVAQTLNTSVSYFFEGLDDTPPPNPGRDLAPSIEDFLLTPDGIELASTFPRIRGGSVRRRVLDLVRAVAEEKGGGDDA